jgi:ribosomal-protein-alanine N-acetyltransferase
VSQTTPTLTIRRALPTDLEAVMAIEEASFRTPWVRQAMIDELSRAHGGLFLVAESGGGLVGYAGVWVFAGEAHVMNIAVDPACRRRGIGEALLLALLARAVEMGARFAYLEVRPSNEQAIALYGKFGFEPYGRRPSYYADTGEDALLMARKLLRQIDFEAAWGDWEARNGKCEVRSAK